jgi:hypothetical protein
VGGTIRGAWEGRLKDVAAECDRLHGSLRDVGVLHGENEHAVKALFPKSKVSDLTPGASGDGKGRW